MKTIIYGCLLGLIGWGAIEFRGIESALIMLFVLVGFLFGNLEEKLNRHGKIIDRHTNKLFPSSVDID